MRTPFACCALVLLIGCTSQTSSGQSASPAPVTSSDWMHFQKPAPQVLRQELSDLQYRVTQQAATEPPFKNSYWHNEEPGIYVDVVSGEPLFSSLDKFDSGTGWPSFSRPIPGVKIKEVHDDTLGMQRVEVRSTYADSHLGHVFTDGPQPTGLRYCINSASLRFVPAKDMARAGYGDYLQPFVKAGLAEPPPAREVAILAGGCFWGMEEIIRKIPGVVETEVGYCGGEQTDVGYDDVHTGETGHAEAVRVVFDPAQLSYADLLLWFFRMHDPTTPNRQGNDVGSQYRSAIFTTSAEQRKTAERVKAEVDAAGHYPDPIVTQITPAGPWVKAEDYHQDYLQRHPNGYTCHYLRDWGDEEPTQAPAPRR